MEDDRYRMIRGGERYQGLWSIFDMKTLTVVTVNGRALEGLSEATATAMLGKLRGANAEGRKKAQQ